MWKHLNKVPWSKEHFWEIDYLALKEDMWDENATSWMLSKMWEEGCLEIKQRIEKALTYNHKENE